MQNKELVTSGQMTQSLIGNWLLLYIVLGIVYNIIIGFITSGIESSILLAIVGIIGQGVLVFLIWKLSILFSFKKKTIAYNDVPQIMKNLIIFVIIVCLFNIIYNFVNINSAINESVAALEYDFELEYTEYLMSYIYDDEEMSEYETQKEEAIEEAVEEVKNELYSSLVISGIGLIVVYLAMLPIEKKEILKYVE